MYINTYAKKYHILCHIAPKNCHMGAFCWVLPQIGLGVRKNMPGIAKNTRLKNQSPNRAVQNSTIKNLGGSGIRSLRVRGVLGIPENEAQKSNSIGGIRSLRVGYIFQLLPSDLLISQMEVTFSPLKRSRIKHPKRSLGRTWIMSSFPGIGKDVPRSQRTPSWEIPI